MKNLHEEPQATIFGATQQDYREAAKWVIQLMAKLGTKNDGGFTEPTREESHVEQVDSEKGMKFVNIHQILFLLTFLCSHPN